MEYGLSSEDRQFEKDFLALQLTSSCFSHQAHLQLAWIYVSRYGEHEGEERIQKDLKKFVTHVGAADKYNEELTIKAYRIMHRRMQQSGADRFDLFLEKNPDLLTDFLKVLDEYSSEKESI